MTTLMQWSNSEGIQGRCDAKCHEATHPECVCICGGVFHGRAHTAGGLRDAVDTYWDDVFAAARMKAADEGFTLEGTPGALRQLHLL